MMDDEELLLMNIVRREPLEVHNSYLLVNNVPIEGR